MGSCISTTLVVGEEMVKIFELLDPQAYHAALTYLNANALQPGITLEASTKAVLSKLNSNAPAISTLIQNAQNQAVASVNNLASVANAAVAQSSNTVNQVVNQAVNSVSQVAASAVSPAPVSPPAPVPVPAPTTN